MRSFLYLLAVVIGSLLTAALVYMAYLSLNWGSPIQVLSGTLMALACIVVVLDLFTADMRRRTSSESLGAFGLISSLVMVIIVIAVSNALGVIPVSMQLTVLLACAGFLGVYLLYRLNARPRLT